jgi:hypothetical protein
VALLQFSDTMFTNRRRSRWFIIFSHCKMPLHLDSKSKWGKKDQIFEETQMNQRIRGQGEQD